jgi:CBS domain-containing protein
MQIPLTSMEQLLPFPTVEEMIGKRREPVVSVSAETTVLAALQQMADKHIGFLPVIEGGRLVGVISERDCARRVLLKQLPAATTLVRDVMTAEVHSAQPEMKIPECVALMHERGVRHLPVMRGSEVVGVLSVRDLMGALIQRHERLLRRLGEERLTLMYPDPSSY